MSKPAVTRKSARRAGVFVVAVAVALTAFAMAKHFAMGGLAESEISAGELAIAEFASGDATRLRDAEEAFRDAASVSIVDYYPAFGLSVVARLEQLQAGQEATKPGDSILLALRDEEWERARAEVDQMRDEDAKRAQYYDRLVEAVRQASMKVE